MSEKNSLNYLFLKRFAHLLHVFLPLSRLSLNVQDHHERIYTHPIVLILLLLINVIGLEFVIYFVGFIPSKFYDALGKPPDQRDIPGFLWLIARSLALVALNALVKASSILLSSLLYVKWRVRLVSYLHSFYFTHQRYYHISNTTQLNSNKREDEHATVYENYSVQTTDIDDNDRESVDYIPASTNRSSKPPIDNPDQRIAQDADSLCRTLSNTLPLVLISPFVIGYYTYRTWKITGYYGPLAILIYFIVWSGINKIFISAISRTIFRQNIAEGNFRFLHTQIRIHNESIAFYNGGPFEHQRFNNYFVKILTPILYRRSLQEFLLSLSTNLYDYIGSIIVYLLLGLAMFVFHLYDNVPSADLPPLISQSYFIAGYLIYRFNQINDIADKATLIAANTHRVLTFVEYMKDIDTTWSERSSNQSIAQNEILIIKNLSYSTPNNAKHVLMRSLNLILNKGQHLLITGESGVGKTSLFRILHSIWPVNNTGSFSYQTARSFLLPQRPYFTNQSLHDELSYPDSQHFPTIARQTQIEQFLIEWNLFHILDWVESSVFTCPKYAWQDLLSPGELQRLSFLRLLLRLSSNETNQIPTISLVFLDEITSSLDLQTEKKMYTYLIEQNLTLISIGHRETLRQYHQLELKLSKNGRYTIENLQIVD